MLLTRPRNTQNNFKINNYKLIILLSICISPNDFLCPSEWAPTLVQKHQLPFLSIYTVLTVFKIMMNDENTTYKIEMLFIEAHTHTLFQWTLTMYIFR